jgi:hypothetical protein
MKNSRFDILAVIEQMIVYLESENYMGYDPYDALNMPLPWDKLGKWLPAITIQTLKHCPVNPRPLLGIKPGYNPKAMGLFLQAFCILYKKTGQPQYLDRAGFFFRWLVQNASKRQKGIGWGYNFRWISPIRDLPAYTPSAVVTAFVCKGINAYYLLTGNSEAAVCLTGAAEFVLNELPVFEDPTGLNFSYTPLQNEICYNASLMAAEILAYTYSLHQNEEVKQTIIKACNFVLSRQKKDGSWFYSEDPEKHIERYQIDFHQGFILESLDTIQQLISLPDIKIQEAIERGLHFYRYNQFTDDGKAYFRLPALFPIDIHHIAQGILTFSRFSSHDPSYLPFSYVIAGWAFDNMFCRKGYFYYRKNRLLVNRVSYIRWSQAWMLLAFSEIL